MDRALTEQTRYYELRLASCARRSDIHRHQVAAYERHLALARSVETIEQYMAAADSFDLAHAESMDRHRVAAAVHATLGNAGKRRAAEIMLDAVGGAGSVAAMWSRVATAAIAAHSHIVRDTVAAHEVPRVAIAIMEWAPEAHPVIAKQRLQDVLDRWSNLVLHDPGCDWQRVSSHPPYRHRLPFDDAGMTSLGSLLVAALRAADGLGMVASLGSLAPVVEPDLSVAVESLAPGATDAAPDVDTESYDPRTNPSVPEIAAGYHLHYDALDRTDPIVAATRGIYERIFAIEAQADMVPAFYRALVEQRLLCKLVSAEPIARARASLASCLPDAHPYLEHHHSLVATRLVPCRTPSEVEYELLVAEECFDVEADWNEVLLACATRPLRAAIRFGLHADEMHERSVRDSLRLTCHLLGVDWPGLMEAPRVDRFLRSALFECGQGPEPGAGGAIIPPDPGTRRGLAGMDIVFELRHALRDQVLVEAEALQDAAAARAHMDEALDTPRYTSADALVDHLRRLVADAHVGEPPAAPGRPALIMWGASLALSECLDAALAPSRPRIEFA